jgi:hypothetical protein
VDAHNVLTAQPVVTQTVFDLQRSFDATSVMPHTMMCDLTSTACRMTERQSDPCEPPRWRCCDEFEASFGMPCLIGSAVRTTIHRYWALLLGKPVKKPGSNRNAPHAIAGKRVQAFMDCLFFKAARAATTAPTTTKLR